MRVIFLGPPAAGKGTQSKVIHDKTGIPLLVMGNILREAVARQDAKGKQLEAYMEQGVLVPDSLIVDIIMARISNSGENFLLDGFPRTISQAKSLDHVIIEKGLEITHVIYYNLDDEVAIARISGRRVCKKCEAIFHLTNNPPKIAGICDLCGGELFLRTDDKEDVMTTRLATYHRETAPLLEYYKAKGIVFEIDANQAIEDILADTLIKLEIA